MGDSARLLGLLHAAIGDGGICGEHYTPSVLEANDTGANVDGDLSVSCGFAFLHL